MLRIMPLGEALDRADVLGDRLPALRAEFDLQENDEFRGHFVCAYRRPKRPGIMHGELFLWDSRLVFRASVMGLIKHKHIEWSDVINLRKKTAMRLPNTIGLDFLQRALERDNTMHVTRRSDSRREAAADAAVAAAADGSVASEAASEDLRQPQHVVLTHFFFSSREKAYDIMFELWHAKRPDLAEMALERSILSSTALPEAAAKRGASAAGRLASRPALNLSHRRQRSLQRLASLQGEDASEAAAVLPWVVAAPALEPPTSDFRLCGELAVPCSPREALEVLLADASGFLAAGAAKANNPPLSMTKWVASATPGVTADRVFRFQYIADGPLGKIRSLCVQDQHLTVNMDGSVSFWYEQRMPDLPGGVGKAFHVVGRWDLAPASAPSHADSDCAAAAPADEVASPMDGGNNGGPLRSPTPAAGAGPGGIAPAAGGGGSSESAAVAVGAPEPSARQGAAVADGGTPAGATSPQQGAAGVRAKMEREASLGLRKLDASLRYSLRAANGILRGGGAPSPTGACAPHEPPPSPCDASTRSHSPQPSLHGRGGETSGAAAGAGAAVARAAAAAQAGSPTRGSSAPHAAPLPSGYSDPSAAGAPAEDKPRMSRAASTPAAPVRACTWRVYLAVRFERNHLFRGKIESNTYAITGKVLLEQAQWGLQWIADPSLRQPLQPLLPQQQPPPQQPAAAVTKPQHLHTHARHVRGGSVGGVARGAAAAGDARGVDARGAGGSQASAVSARWGVGLGRWEALLVVLLVFMVGGNLLLLWRMAELHAEVSTALVKLAGRQC